MLRGAVLPCDSNGTIDLKEAKKAASAAFDRLDRDHDGTLDKREPAGRLSAKAITITTADPDHDKTRTKDEYPAVVEQRFKAANLDNDGTLDVRDLATGAGAALLRLMR
jgi:Ca2+-binding EF-hand superfamily protein